MNYFDRIISRESVSIPIFSANTTLLMHMRLFRGQPKVHINNGTAQLEAAGIKFGTNENLCYIFPFSNFGFLQK